MQVERKLVPIKWLIFSMLFGVCVDASAQQPKGVVLSANGEGAIKIGREEFRISAVVVKLLEDGKTELTLVSDISIFISGNWSDGGDARKEINLQITGGTTKGGLEGNGKVLLREDGKSIASLTLQVVNASLKRNIDVSFVAK
jgi:hypothetical protein